MYSRHLADHSSIDAHASTSSRASTEQVDDGDEKQRLMEGSSEESEGGGTPEHHSEYLKQRLVNPDVVRDIIIGLSDGLTVPFALTAGLSGLDNAKIVVIGGVAELVSGAISMGVGGMLSAQAELHHYRHAQAQTARHVRTSMPATLEGEVNTIFQPLGLSSATSARVAEELLKEERRGDDGLPLPCTTTSAPTQHYQGHQHQSQQGHRSRGLTPLLLRMGEGLEAVDEGRVWQSALTIGSSYLIGGFIPLFPYLLFPSVTSALLASITITALALLIFGIIKQRCIGLGDWRSLTHSALSTLAVGAVAAGSSWGIVRVMRQ